MNGRNTDESDAKFARQKSLSRKSFPDLSAIEHSGEIAHRNVDELSDAELHEIAAGRGADPAEPQSGADEPPPVH